MPDTIDVGARNTSVPFTDSAAQPPAMQSDDPVSVLRNAFTTRLIMFCKLFKRWDYERNGTISPKEFRAALRSMELPHAADDEVCDSIFDEIDSDHSGLVTEYECQRYAVLLLLQSQVNRLHNLFKLWDVDCSGAIDKEEWRDAIKALGIEAPIVAVDRLFRELDEDRSGELVYEELNKKLRSPKGTVAQDIVAATPSREVQAERRALAATSAMARIKRFQARSLGPGPMTPQPPLFTSLAVPAEKATTSSRPPSPSTSSSCSDDAQQDPFADAEDLAKYLLSTRLQDAESDHAAALAKQQEDEREAAKEGHSSKRAMLESWPYHRRRSSPPAV